MTKITNRKIDPAYEIYLSLYQAVSSVDDQRNAYKEFSPDFFDLVVVDECHRGSATEDSSWREILDYFSSATQIGLTATPKEVKPKKGETLIKDPEFNLKYFGNAIYTYSLKQGIEDGFLAPYKVVRIDIDKDLEGWRPTEEMKDKHGQIIQDRTYNQKDFDKTLVLEKRTTLVAQKITRFLKETNRFDKTIVFCEDIDHAERMRSALVNENADLYAINNKYVMRITGDSKEGKNELDQFILPEEKYPVIVTTSELMTTGVDAKTCKLIVLDKNIQSMTKFKQIIGRGTRIDEDYNKMYFTIMDFKKASERFSDTDFDGEPVAIHIPLPDESPVPPDEPVDDGKPTTGDPSNELETDKPNETGDGTEIITTGDDSDTGGGNQPPPPPPKPRIKYYVNNVEVSIVKERVQYYGPDGKLITESLTDYTRKQVHNEFPSLDQFLQKWSEADRKEAILEELEQSGILLEELAEQVGKGFDPFDLICHIAYGQPPLTRRERAENVKKRNYFAKYGEKARAVLEALLDKNADEGIVTIEASNVLRVQPLSGFGTPVEIVRLFGGKEQFDQAIRELESQLYATAS